MTVYCKTLQILLPIITQCESYFLQNAREVYYKMRHVFYYKMWRLLQIARGYKVILHITIYVKKTFTKLLLIRKLIFCINSIFAMTNQRTLAHFELILPLGFLLSLLFSKELKNT